MRNQLPDTFGHRARTLRNRADLSTIEAAYVIRDHLPRSEWRSYQAIHRLEVGETSEENASPVLLAALARVYGVPLYVLSPLADEARQCILALLSEDDEAAA